MISDSIAGGFEALNQRLDVVKTVRQQYPGTSFSCFNPDIGRSRYVSMEDIRMLLNDLSDAVASAIHNWANPRPVQVLLDPVRELSPIMIVDITASVHGSDNSGTDSFQDVLLMVSISI
jgi:hypothetical protein